MRIKRFVAPAIFLALVVLATSGCSTICTVVSDDIAQVICPAPTPPVGDVYVIAPDAEKRERTIDVPGAVEIEFTNKQPGTPDREENLFYAFEAGKGWYGGNPPAGSGIFTVAARDYNKDNEKLKVYGWMDGIKPEKMLPAPWNPAVTYVSRLEFAFDGVTWIISSGGVEITRQTVACAVPPQVTVGYSWPPEKRKGAEGVRVLRDAWQ